MYYKLLLLDAVADYDLPYIYKSEEPLEGGQLVLVPFGAGNRSKEALVLGPSEEYAEAKSILSIVSKPLDEQDLEAIHFLSQYYAMPPAAYARLFLPKALRVEPKIHWVMRDDLFPLEKEEFFSLVEGGGDALAKSPLAKKEISFREKVRLPKEEWLSSLLLSHELLDYLDGLPHTHHHKRRIVEELYEAFPSPIPRGDLALSSIKSLEKEGILRRRLIPKSIKQIYHEMDIEKKELPKLSSSQEKALEELLSGQGQSLLQGVSASGKSYLYLYLAKHCLEQKKNFLLLVPEGSLIPAMAEHFKRYFEERVGVYHGQMSQTEEKAELLAYLEGKYPIMITTRKGLFLPLDDVEMLVLDECQDDAYLSKHPYFHAVELASFFAKQGRARLIFASATPPLSLKLQEDLRTVRLDEAYHERKLDVELIDMRRELSEGNASPLSRKLRNALATVVKKRGLAFLLMNKRLYASYVFCRTCGEALLCPNCGTSLSYDQKRKMLVCAACTYKAAMKKNCPHCGSHAFRYYGGGLQQVVEELRKSFPAARILSLDAVTMRRKLGYIELHRKLQNGEVDILVGTPLIARGLDFDVDLLAVINADFYLHLPNYRSGEKTYELLHQFLGRGGRRKESKALLQTYEPKNYVLTHVLKGDTDGFLKQEAALRESRDLPPFTNYLLIRVQGEIHRVNDEAMEMANYLREQTDVFVSEPYGNWSAQERKILLRSKDAMDEVKELLLSLRQDKKWKFTVEVNPLSMI